MLRTRSMTDSSTVMYIDQVSACSSVLSTMLDPNMCAARSHSLSALSPGVQIPRVRREEGNRLLRAGFLSTPLDTRLGLNLQCEA